VPRRHWYCWTEWRDWFTVWVDFVEIALMNCWTERMSLHLDERSGRSYNTPGTLLWLTMTMTMTMMMVTTTTFFRT
jgi:hypothetical protein